MNKDFYLHVFELICSDGHSISKWHTNCRLITDWLTDSITKKPTQLQVFSWFFVSAERRPRKCPSSVWTLLRSKLLPVFQNFLNRAERDPRRGQNSCGTKFLSQSVAGKLTTSCFFESGWKRTWRGSKQRWTEISISISHIYCMPVHWYRTSWNPMS